jgi:ribosomal protein L37E
MKKKKKIMDMICSKCGHKQKTKTKTAVCSICLWPISKVYKTKEITLNKTDKEGDKVEVVEGTK